MHELDRPVWSSLDTYHAPLSEGGALARQFAPDINLFASARDDSDEALTALTALVGVGKKVFVLQVPEIIVPRGFRVAKAAKGVQMVATGGLSHEMSNDDFLSLGDSDASEMMALAKLTDPGPFLPRTHSMGAFIGVRIDGRLAAMAGERLRMPGYTEVSGVCTHPDFRGRGLAGRLSTSVAFAIKARGEQPFLHAWKTNLSAISLYERLGFHIRTEVNVAVLERIHPVT